MNIADSFYVALCMTVLLLGVVYWFWTQTQYLQRKINLLENIVYELKTSIDHGGTGGSPPPSQGGPRTEEVSHEETQGPQAGPGREGLRLEITPSPVYPPAPGSELGEDEDLLHETLLEESDGKVEAVVEPVSGAPFAEASIPEDLRPGGVGSGLSESVVSSIPSDAQRPRASVLDGMTLKELRRLGEQRNIPGASTLRKQALIDLLRAETKGIDVKASDAKASEETAATATAVEAPAAVRPFDDSVIELA
jgi:hypothetical protein